MDLMLISTKLCPYVHRAAITLREKNVPFERREIDLKNKPDWFAQLSPYGKVPVLLADGAPLFESIPILEFLDETHPPSLLPDDPVARAQQRAWAEGAVELTQAQWNLLVAATPADRDKTTAAFQASADRVERALESGVIPGQGFQRVHVTLAPPLYRFGLVERGLGIKLLDPARWPRLEALARAVGARPSVTETVAPDYAGALCRRIVDRGSLLAREARQA